MEHISETIKGEFQVTKRTLQRAVAVETIRRQRDESKQELAWHDKRFVLCSLPIKRPPKGTLSYIRRNGNVTLSISTDPALGYSLPFGSFDRLTLLYLCTQAVRTRSSIIRFRSGAEILKASGWGLDGRSYRRLVASLHRLIGCSITVQRKDENEQVFVEDIVRLNFIKRLRVWFTKGNVHQSTLEGCENEIELSADFVLELLSAPVPVDLAVLRELRNSPGAIDFYSWICFRSFTARRSTRIPLFGSPGNCLIHQLGTGEYTRQREFRRRIREWLSLVQLYWPECRATLQGDTLVVPHGQAIAPAQR